MLYAKTYKSSPIGRWRYAGDMGNAIGVILAGGGGTRMGRDKALVPFLGEAMIGHIAAAIEKAGLDVLVVGRRDGVAGLETVPDEGEPGRGPMAGMVTGLRTADGGAVFLVAVDQPLLRPETIVAMLALPGDAVVPVSGGHPQVTCALYRRACLEPALTALAAGQMKLRVMLGEVNTTYVGEDVWSAWGEDGSSWLSLDTPEAVRVAEATLRR
jgi:molybdopterin-guanine dinucleotide biosynthesis protein A